MRCRVTITAEYEVPDDQLMEAYGTANRAKAAAIDMQNEPAEMLEYCQNISMHIDVLD